MKSRASWQISDKTALAVHNETRKHHASMCNTVAGGVLAAGFLNPVITLYLKYLAAIEAGKMATAIAVEHSRLLDAPQIADKVMEAANIGSLAFAFGTAIPYIIAAGFIHFRGRSFFGGDQVRRGYCS